MCSPYQQLLWEESRAQALCADETAHVAPNAPPEARARVGVGGLDLGRGAGLLTQVLYN